MQADITPFLAIGAGGGVLACAACYWLRPKEITTKEITKYAYIHGFASDPTGMKGKILKQSFGDVGLPLELPDMNKPSPETMTCSASLHELDRMHAQAQANGKYAVKWCLIGSSMGGYLAARWAELHPGQVDKLVLMSPAFDFPKVLEGIMEPEGSKLSDWEVKGSWSFEEYNVQWCMMADYLQHPSEPEVPCPTLIIHGKKDDQVPISTARSYAYNRLDLVELVEMNDDHLLVESIPAIVPLISGFFDIKLKLTLPAVRSK